MSDVEIEQDDQDQLDAKTEKRLYQIAQSATPSAKRAEQERLKRDVERFLKSGGKITQIETGTCKDTTKSAWARTETAYNARQERAK